MPTTCSRQFLIQSFQSSYDRSKISSWLSRVRSTHGGLNRPMIGSGRHFDTYLFPELFPGPFQLVIKIGNQDFKKKYLTPDPEVYLNRLRKAQKLADQTLIPPFDWFFESSDFVMVMPYGNASREKADECWLPLENWVNKSAELLAKAGLVINDIAQLRTFLGIPFIIDMSDLVPVSASIRD